MRKFTVNILALSLGMAGIFSAVAAPSAQQQLLEQVRVGEATNREDLVRQSLYRLELIAPDDPQVIAAKMRYALRQGDSDTARQALDRLSSLAPGSDVYYQARNSMMLSGAQGRQQLQQARLLATAGKTREAIDAYQALFGENPPEGDLAVEYWSVVAGDPARRAQAINALSKLNQRYPSVQLRSKLAQLLLSDGRSEAAFQVLEQMARSPGGRDEAAALWFRQLADLPPSAASVSALQRFLTVFNSGDNADKAREKLADMQKKLADPAFSARAEALAKVNNATGGNAIPALEKAAAETRNDSELVGALGEAWSQKGNRAKAVQQLEKALRLAPQGPGADKWKSLLQMNRYWLLIQQGDDALKAKNLDLAWQKYQQARNQDSTDSYAPLGLGDVAVARNDDATAERYYQQALRMDKGNSNAARGLANIYRRHSLQKAQAFIQTLSARLRRSIDDIERSLRDEQLSEQAAALEAKGQWLAAAAIQRQRLAMDPQSVWVTYRLAKNLDAAGQRSEASALFSDLARRHPGDPEQVYAVGLWLASIDQDQAAQAHLNTLPQDKWNDNIRELSARLARNQIMAKANRLRDGGHEPQAIALLVQQPENDDITLTLAGWAAERQDFAQAKRLYAQALQHDPNNQDARLGMAEALIATGDKAAARRQLTALMAPSSVPLSLNTRRRIATALAAVGEKNQAQALWQQIIPEAKSQPPSMESALVLRDAARAQAASGDPVAALSTWRDAMVAAGVAPARAQSNEAFTRLTRNNASDDWLKRGVRSDAADLYRQQDINVSLDHDYWGSSGTPGYSDLKAHTTMLQVDAPLSDGRMFLRTDVVNMNAGTFQADNNGKYSPRWGTCGARDNNPELSYQESLLPCSGSQHQSASGVSLATGWHNDTWSMDLGTTPLGFDVVDVVGGLSYSNKMGNIGYTLDVHRRPVSSSLLAFAGQKDPHTGVTWGGVRANGGGISLSYDQGKANGVWSSLSADQLVGKNVDDNWRVRWMTGYYYKLINEDNRRVSIGLTNMLWHYEKDLSAYTLGQGGYYSPQQYVSFAVPIIWRQRTENWSWEVGGSVSWSHSRSHNSPRYPLSNLIPDNYADKYDSIDGGSSQGVGYTARAVVERRVTSHWSVGLGVDIQEAKDYTPSHAMMFARYSLGGWQGDMNMPPQPQTPYADW